MASSKISIWNMALAELPTARVDAIDDGSLEAETCAIHYQPSLDLLLESHDWEFAVKRATLAEITNERSSEWFYAYALPSDMARPQRILPNEMAGGANVTVGQVWLGSVTYHGNVIDYRIAGSTIYTNQGPALIEYSSNNPSEAVFTAKFARALALELASRIVMPILKQSKRQGELLQMAEVARERAVADDMMRDTERVGDFVPDVGYVRGGWPVDLGLPSRARV